MQSCKVSGHDVTIACCQNTSCLIKTDSEGGYLVGFDEHPRRIVDSTEEVSERVKSGSKGQSKLGLHPDYSSLCDRPLNFVGVRRRGALKRTDKMLTAGHFYQRVGVEGMEGTKDAWKRWDQLSLNGRQTRTRSPSRSSR